jgi:undecaprenyl diphosphate synthase
VDGNRRWARRHGLPYERAYWLAGENLVRIVGRAAQLGVETVTAFLFSTENWQRDKAEVMAVMKAFEGILFEYTETFKRQGVRVRAIGELSALPEGICRAIKHAESETAEGSLNFVMAFNYGGRWDLLQAARGVLGLLSPEKLCEKRLQAALATAPYGDPDFLIRTGGDRRLSNFMLWQIAYTELYFSDFLWPDFSPEAFDDALGDYARRERRKGA